MNSQFVSPSIQKSSFQEQELNSYKTIGTVYESQKNWFDDLMIFHEKEEVNVYFGNRKFTLTNSDILTLAKKNGLFKNFKKVVDEQ